MKITLHLALLVAERTEQMNEPDFIINYDIKYCMGDELNASE